MAGEINGDTTGNHAKNSQKQHITHDADHNNPAVGRRRNFFDVFFAADALIEQAVSTRITDVTPDSTANNSGDCRKVNIAGEHGFTQCHAQWWV